MPPDSNIPSYNDNPKPGNVPPLLPASEPPVISAPPPLVTGAPPALPPPSPGKSSPVRRLLAILLSLCLGLFLADAVVSLLDDSLLLFFDIHILTTLRGILFLFAIFMAILIYGLMAVTPMIPKRLFLPVTLFNPVAGLLVIPFLIYFYSRVQQIAWVVS